MAINSVDMNKALTNEAYASQVVRSGQCTASQRGQLAAHWGNGKVTKWESVDSTKYEITDDKVSTAKESGDKKVDEATGGFDGKSDGTKAAVGTGAAAVAGAAGAVVGVATGLATFAKVAAPKSLTSGWTAAIVGGALLSMSAALKAMDINHEQAQACDDLAPVMQDSQNELEDQQGILSDTTNEIVDSTDELSEASEEANKQTETKQKEYERLQQEYQALQEKYQASKSGGEPLTEAEKARYEQLSGVLGTKFEELQQVKVDGDAAVEEAKETVEEQQEVYDDAAMKVEEVQEITDFQAEFDEATVDNAKMVKTAAYIGEVGAAANAIASGTHLWKAATIGGAAEAAAGAIGVATSVASGIILGSVISDQNDYLSRAEAGVENRQATEDVNTATSELYDEELDNYAGSIDLIDEIEITESTATETPIVALDETTSEEEPVAGNDNTAENQTPQFGLLTVGSANGEDSKPTDKGDDDKKEEV